MLTQLSGPGRPPGTGNRVSLFYVLDLSTSSSSLSSSPPHPPQYSPDEARWRPMPVHEDPRATATDRNLIEEVCVCVCVCVSMHACKRHRFNKVPGRAVGIPFKFVYPSPRLNSDAGYAVLLLTLLGAPVSNEHRKGPGPHPGWPYASGLSLDSTALASPGTGPHVPVRHHHHDDHHRRSSSVVQSQADQAPLKSGTIIRPVCTATHGYVKRNRRRASDTGAVLPPSISPGTPSRTRPALDVVT